ncbi:MAG: hypothetical protein J6Q68_03230 [Clostridia bacterium]|nr:hypothetical protein [Clostridia bacterium]
MKELEISEYSGEGYKPLISSDGWRVAIVNACERFLEEKLVRSERHLETDEVFVLIKGDASLFIGEDRKRYDMEIGKFYNVKKGAWHNMSMTENSIVLIVENDNTGPENTEYMSIKSET